MKNVIMTAAITAVLVIGIAMSVGEIAYRRANEVFDAKEAEIARLENQYSNISTKYRYGLGKMGNMRKEISDYKQHQKIKTLGKMLVAASTTAPEPNETLAFTDLVQESVKGVVHIMCPQWQGSGFVISPNVIVTARHCVEGVEDFIITTSDGHQVRATRAISDKKHDVAFIRVDDLTCVEGDQDGLTCVKTEHEVVLTPLRLGPIKDCVLGQGIYVIGSPHGKVNFNSLTKGIISGVNVDWSPLGDDYGWDVAFTTDSAGHPGNSGGPVFTMDGVVRGILVGGFSPVLISVMPCDLFLSDLEEIRLMFNQDKYRFEEAPVGNDYYNYKAGNEYY